MELITLSLTEEEAMRLEAIFMDKDKEEVLRFLLEVIKPKIRAKGSRASTLKKGRVCRNEHQWRCHHPE
jgi:hypothetical protein